MRTLEPVRAPAGPLSAARRRQRAGDASRSASVLYDLDVPDFAKGPLVDERRGAHVGRVVARADGAARRRAETGAAGASRGETGSSRSATSSSLFAEVYDNAGGSPHKVDITTTVTADEGKVLFKIGGHARFVGPAGKERRLRLQHAGAAEGDAAGTVCAESRGAVASRPGTDGQSPGAVPDRGGRAG